MVSDITDADAQLALSAIDLRRRDVIIEIGMPWWYWWGLGASWVALGIISDLGIVWASGLATLAVGAVHASVGHRVLSGRHRSGRLSVRADLASRGIPFLVIGFLILLVGVTIGIALLVDADGAGHPGTIASLLVAAALVSGGPRLMAVIRRSDGGHART